MNDEEIEAYLRKHTLNGQIRELHDACVALGHALGHALVHALMRDASRMLLHIFDFLGM